MEALMVMDIWKEAYMLILETIMLELTPMSTTTMITVLPSELADI